MPRKLLIQYEGDLYHEGLAKLGHTDPDLQASRCGEPWKVELALQLRKEQGVSCVWLSQHLSLGTPDAARSLLSHARQAKIQRYSA